MASVVSRFEDKHFGTQHSGYVDPGGKMLALMEKLAAAPKPAAETNLDILRRNVLNIPSVVSKFHGNSRFTAGDLVHLDGLVKMAVNHIDELKSRKDKAGAPLVELPWWGEVFGTAWVGQVLGGHTIIYINGKIVDRDAVAGRDQILFAAMNNGVPMSHSATVVTTPSFPALLLFYGGFCYPLKSNNSAEAAAAREYAQSGFYDF
jgi:hypothetical protein